MGASAAQLNAMLVGSPTGARMPFDAASQTLTEWTNPVTNIDAAALLIPDDSASDLRFVWQRLSAPAAALVMPPESRGQVILDPTQLDSQPFRNDHAPVWELIIRLTTEAKAVELLDKNDTATDDLLPQDVGLPDIAPNWPPRNRGWLVEHLRVFQPDATGDGASPRDPVALHAGLWLIHDFLDESHELSQSIQGRGGDRNGDYWHGIMHRREPDWSNSKYWFRRVGDHPIFFDLAGIAGRLLQESQLSDADRWSQQLSVSSTWDPFAFVDLCQSAARDSKSELASIARRIQWAEILLLLAHCS